MGNGSCFRHPTEESEPYIKEISVSTPNALFYQNGRPATPNKENIEQILLKWKGNYQTLERNHYYIQWLFPNRKAGINKHASILTDEEAKCIRRSPELRDRVRRAFQMMLDFYGMSLTKENQFGLTENYKERLRELNQLHNHNFLRISRILLALKELGHSDLMLPWLMFLADLIYEKRRLLKAEDSFQNFWMDTLDAEDRISLIQYLQRYTRNQMD